MYDAENNIGMSSTDIISSGDKYIQAISSDGHYFIAEPYSSGDFYFYKYENNKAELLNYIESFSTSCITDNEAESTTISGFKQDDNVYINKDGSWAGSFVAYTEVDGTYKRLAIVLHEYVASANAYGNTRSYTLFAPFYTWTFGGGIAISDDFSVIVIYPKGSNYYRIIFKGSPEEGYTEIFNTIDTRSGIASTGLTYNFSLAIDKDKGEYVIFNRTVYHIEDTTVTEIGTIGVEPKAFNIIFNKDRTVMYINSTTSSYASVYAYAITPTGVTSLGSYNANSRYSPVNQIYFDEDNYGNGLILASSSVTTSHVNYATISKDSNGNITGYTVKRSGYNDMGGIYKTEIRANATKFINKSNL